MKISRRDYRKGVGKDLPANKKESSQKGVSGYLKSKKKTLKELDAATGEGVTNELDRVEQVMDREDEDSKGITNHIRNIFSK